MPGNQIKPGLEIEHAEANVVAAGRAGMVVALRWRIKGSAADNCQFQALRMRDGLIFDMQDYRRRDQAERVVR